MRLNLAEGGVLEAPGVFGGSTSHSDDYPHPFIVNFDGGVLRSPGAGSDSLFAWLSAGRRVSDVCVYGRGAVIDAPSGTVVQHDDTPIAAHVAGGIQSIRLPKEYSGLIGAPEVVIDNLEGAIVVGDNAIGGLTKRGAATLTLNATNERRQWMSVEGGRLVAGSSEEIPDGTANPESTMGAILIR